MKTLDQIISLVGTYGVAIINSNDGMIQNFRLSIDSIEQYEDSVSIFNLDDAEFVIPVNDETSVKDNTIFCKRYRVEISV